MSCGHLAEPLARDPMRSEGRRAQSDCPICGAPGLVDLRHTPTLFSLSELEANETQLSRWGRTREVLALLLGITVYVALASFVVRDQLGYDFGLLAAGCILVPLTLLSLSLFVPLISALARPGARERRDLPRRWRLPRHATIAGKRLRVRARGPARGTSATELLRAPLSGRPCLAYEVAVRHDPSPATSSSSWRLVEQHNAAFRIGELDVAPGEALLRLPRELASCGTLMNESPATQRFMRMRGLLDSEQVYVYETILAPGAECGLSRCESTGAAEVFA